MRRVVAIGLVVFGWCPIAGAQAWNDTGQLCAGLGDGAPASVHLGLPRALARRFEHTYLWRSGHIEIRSDRGIGNAPPQQVDDAHLAVIDLLGGPLNEREFTMTCAVEGSVARIRLTDDRQSRTTVDVTLEVTTDEPASLLVDIEYTCGAWVGRGDAEQGVELSDRAVYFDPYGPLKCDGSRFVTRVKLPEANDYDVDGVADCDDNCGCESNPNQENLDGDTYGDVCDRDRDGDDISEAIDGDLPDWWRDGPCRGREDPGQGACERVLRPRDIQNLNLVDNCPAVANPGQADWDGDGTGDACDDSDGDGVLDHVDNCRMASNPEQRDWNHDGAGDACDDSDGDGVLDHVDNCRRIVNRRQLDQDRDGKGDRCDDSDGDGLPDADDNCPTVHNPNQEDADAGGACGRRSPIEQGPARGDACDPDDDGDGRLDGEDNCPRHCNPDQADRDGDGVGDACDLDKDGDRILDIVDNCPGVKNGDQRDADADGDGDLCDDDDDGDGTPDRADGCPYNRQTTDAARCRLDRDGDGRTADDPCPEIPDWRWLSYDDDPDGRACDDDDDDDGVADGCDIDCQWSGRRLDDFVPFGRGPGGEGDRCRIGRAATARARDVRAFNALCDGARQARQALGPAGSDQPLPDRRPPRPTPAR